MTVRPARIDELSRVFRLTYEFVGGGSVTRHIVACKRDRKLRSGTHFILEDDIGEFVATVTAYAYRHPPVGTATGFSNLFTPASLRHRGYASRLLAGAISQLEGQGESIFYLLSDIGTGFYERLGFRTLPVVYEPVPDAIPMLRCPPEDWNHLTTNTQFLLGLMAFVD